MEKELNIILKKLPSLNKKTLTEIRDKIDFLLSGDTGKVSRVDEELFYLFLIEEIKKATKKKYPPYPVFKKQKYYKKFKEAFDSLLDYIAEVFKNERLSRPKRQQFYMISVKLVMNDLLDSPIPVNINTVITTFANLPGLIDRAFPGYVGLLPMILKAKYMNKKTRE